MINMLGQPTTGLSPMGGFSPAFTPQNNPFTPHGTFGTPTDFAAISPDAT